MHWDYCYEKRKEGNVIFNNVLNTFYLQLYGGGDVAPWWSVCLWVVVSIPHGGPIELFLVPTSAPQLV